MDPNGTAHSSNRLHGLREALDKIAIAGGERKAAGSWFVALPQRIRNTSRSLADRYSVWTEGTFRAHIRDHKVIDYKNSGTGTGENATSRMCLHSRERDSHTDGRCRLAVVAALFVPDLTALPLVAFTQRLHPWPISSLLITPCVGVLPLRGLERACCRRSRRTRWRLRQRPLLCTTSREHGRCVTTARACPLPGSRQQPRPRRGQWRLRTLNLAAGAAPVACHS